MTAPRWLLAITVVASCSAPDLDRTGAILCGPANADGVGLCPSGYECRLEHCCPSTSATSACPGETAATTGAPCGPGTCTLSSTASTACCATVNANAREVFRGGYATMLNCTSNAQCGAYGTCTTLQGIGRPACWRRCTYRAGMVTPCRDAASEIASSPSGSYVCVPDPEGRAPNDGVCIPDCTAVPTVCGNDVCDPATHTCHGCTANTSCAAGQVCNRSSGQCSDPCTALTAVRLCGALTLCVLRTGNCIYCPETPCPAGFSCNATTGRCAAR